MKFIAGPKMDLDSPVQIINSTITVYKCSLECSKKKKFDLKAHHRESVSRNYFMIFHVLGPAIFQC